MDRLLWTDHLLLLTGDKNPARPSLKGGLYMQYDLTPQEIKHIENYRNLFPEFQKTLDKQMKALHDLQIGIVKQSINGQ